MVISKSSSIDIDEQSEENLAQLVSNEIIETTTKQRSPSPQIEYIVSARNDTNKKKRKKPKWRNVSQELALFKCKRAAEHALYFVNTFNIEMDNNENEEFNEYNENYYHVNNYTASGVVRLIEETERLENPNIYESSKEEKNSTPGLKKLIKSNDVKSLVRHDRALDFPFDNLRKGNTIIHIKYNLYKKIVGQLMKAYVPFNQRLRHEQAPNRVDSRHQITAEFLAENKKFFKSIRKLDMKINTNTTSMNNTRTTQHRQDPQVVTANSINSAHRTVFDDPEYLEFLIQLQHREITPEDYEFLTRLDERIKKRTTDEAILAKLRTETIAEDSADDDESCGICLDSYLVGHKVKYLPCGHRFHAECIDSWLKNQSINCPLDNLPIDSSLTNSSPPKIQTRDVSTPLHTVLEDPDESFISNNLYFFDDFSISISYDDSYHNDDTDEIDDEVLAVMNTVLDSVDDRIVLNELLDELLNKVAQEEN